MGLEFPWRTQRSPWVDDRFPMGATARTPPPDLGVGWALRKQGRKNCHADSRPHPSEIEPNLEIRMEIELTRWRRV